MFRKPFHVKTNSAIKTSECRKLRANVLQAFPSVTTEQLDSVVPVKGEVRLAKLQTSADGIVLCYVVNSVPLFFSTKDGPLLPTVYALWLLPSCVPSLSTNSFVAKKILGGADLMLPGVAVPSDNVHCLPPLTVGEPVAVNDCITSAFGAFAVGKMLKSNRDIKFDGMNGKGVAILHYVTDYLWEFGPKTQPPSTIQREQTMWTSADGSSENEETSAHSDTDDTGAAVQTTADNSSQPTHGTTDSHAQTDEHTEDTHTATQTERNTHRDDAAPMSAEEALRYAFLTSWKTSAKSDNVLPVLVSAFYGSHMVPARMPGTDGLDIKGSKYKKIGKFLQDMEKEGIITLKEQSKGVSVITSVNRTHEALAHHRVIKGTVNKEVSDTATSGKRGTVTDVYRPSDTLRFLFDAKQETKHTYVTDRQMRQLIDQYADANGCVSKTNPRMLVCDPWLGKLTNQLEIARDEITKLAVQKCQKYHQVTAADGSTTIRKGAFKPIEIIIEKRMGTKMVTLIRNLKPFEIPLATFVKEISNVMASSATVQPSPSAAGGEQEILVQGNASTQAVKLLSENYGVDKKHVSIVNKSGAKGKKKK
ncbi:hypothetical protein SARC_01711 [Sphaeroforma arctica JP610]|uniref:SUI1 domain-containing protein n=1 Tax=Sphaeroforma arctica JP610 TaxID=667725 RepID=A0A0L0GAW1_9EUKA|nr:hypothetical protein SARC_01711 [Sphaeroforma arctica JP610]KNC86142.1 hypothetical protein SARC_01711 [Sphaeroforma arctica JP610]|eukprot:XP_014160044.1 hypothetical protein SARC_01711 [Sphaeroforma arctica JP610]